MSLPIACLQPPTKAEKEAKISATDKILTNISHVLGKKKVCVVFLRCAGEADERLPLGKSVQLCAYLLFVGALAARLSDG